MADFARSANPRVQAQLDRLSKLSPAGDRLGLDRIAALLERLGRPQDGFRRCSTSPGPTAKARSAPSFARGSKRRATSPRLHQPAPGSLQRTDPDRRPADRGRSARRAPRRGARRQRRGSSRAFSRSRPRSRFSPLPARPAGRVHPRSRPRRPARRDQHRRAAGGMRNRGPRDRSSIVPRRRLAFDRTRKSGDRQARRASGLPRLSGGCCRR